MVIKNLTRGVFRHIACFVIAQITFVPSVLITNLFITTLFGEQGAVGDISVISIVIGLLAAVYAYVFVNRTLRFRQVDSSDPAEPIKEAHASR